MLKWCFPYAILAFSRPPCTALWILSCTFASKRVMIGFDAKRAAQNKTGLGNYSRFIIEGLTKFLPGERFLLYTPNPSRMPYIGTIPQKSNVEMRYPQSTWWKKFRSIWRVWGITQDLERDGIRLFHGLSNELPLNIRKAHGVRSIVTIHDLIYLRYPKDFHYIDRQIYAYKFRKACENADRIIAVSECTKRDIMQYFHIPEEKIDVVYQGCDEQFKQPASNEKKREVSEKYRLPVEYILYVGSIEGRKNLMLLAQSLQFLPEHVEVIAVGKHTPYADQVNTFLRHNGLQQRMKLIHNVPFGDLPALYQMASVFVYPSFFEGFGIPLVEALNSGIPAIGATGSCLEEAGGPHSIYVDPTDAHALACAIERVLTDAPLRQQMIEEGRKYALHFEQKRVIEQLLSVYRKVLE